MAYKRRPMYHFKNVTDTGVNMIPLKQIVNLEETNTLYVKESDMGLDFNTTVNQAIVNANLVPVSGMGGSTEFNIVGTVVKTEILLTENKGTFDIDYTEGYIDVYVNGIALFPSDWTEIINTGSINQIQLNEDILSGDSILFKVFEFSEGSTGSVITEPSAILVSSPEVSGDAFITNGYREVNINFYSEALLAGSFIAGYNISWGDGSTTETALNAYNHTYAVNKTVGETEEVTVVAFDNIGNLSQETKYILTYTDNQYSSAPTSSAMPDIIHNGMITKQFTGSIDPDGVVGFYEVFDITNPLLSVGEATVTVNTNHVFYAGSTLTDVLVNFKVAAIDDAGMRGSSTIYTIKVLGNQIPSNPTSGLVYEGVINTTINTTFGGAVDPDGEVVSYVITNISGNVDFGSNLEKNVGEAFTFTFPGSAGPYSYKVQARDNSGSLSTGITVNSNVIAEVDPPPPDANVGTYPSLENLKYKIASGKDVTNYPVDQLTTLSYLCSPIGTSVSGYTETEIGRLTAFNQNISGWDTSNITDMTGVFIYTTAFNQNISGWDTSKVTKMNDMFKGTTAFNKSLTSWNTSNVTRMSDMFREASAFNGSLSGWNTSKVTNMSNMFLKAVKFNQPLNTWNTGNVTNMGSMFAYALDFNQPLDNWDTSKVTNFGYMFSYSPVFNQSLNSWNTGSATSLYKTFYYATAFNGDVGSWNVSNVGSFEFCFSGASSFNRSLFSWNLSSATFISYMFAYAYSFNQNISNWNVSSTLYCNGFGTGSGLSCSNYPALAASCIDNNCE